MLFVEAMTRLEGQLSLMVVSPASGSLCTKAIVMMPFQTLLKKRSTPIVFLADLMMFFLINSS